MKKIISVLVIISLFTSALFILNVSAESNEIWTWVDSMRFTEHGTYCELTECLDYASGEIVIPSHVEFRDDYLPVTTISNSAFGDCTEVTGITIPDSVTLISKWAFHGCTNLTNVNIPESVTFIDCYAFNDCKSLTEIFIPENTDLGVDLFEGCTNLRCINVDENNPYFSSLDGVLFNKELTKLNSYPNAKGSKYVVPSGVRVINTDAFSKCTGLTDITIPEGVMIIGTGAFYGCTGLTNVTIPSSADIYSYAFEECTGLTEVKISDGVWKIYSAAFSSCTALTEITIPDSVSIIENGAFRNCTGLKSVIMSDNLHFINSLTFNNCINLESIVMPKDLYKIEESAFNNCTGLRTVYFKGSEEEWKEITIESTGNETLLAAEVVFNYRKIILGDVNEDEAADNKDVVFLFRYVSGSEKAEDETFYDFNGDGEINNKDVASLFRYLSSAQ